jgi:hypothetical protein
MEVAHPNRAARRALASNREHPYGQHPKPNRAFGKSQVAERYGNVHTRTVDRRVERGEIPPADFHQGRLSYWWESTLDQHDEAAAREERIRREAKAETEKAAAP